MTNQFTDEQVERAAKALFEDPLATGDYSWAEMVTEDPKRADMWRDDARRILAAAGVAPQVPSVTDKCAEHNPTQHRDTKPPWCKTCGLTANGMIPVGSKFPSYAAPVQPSSTVDEGKLAEVIRLHTQETKTEEGHPLDRDTVCAECGYAFRIAAENTAPPERERRQYEHVARAVAEWLRGESHGR